MPRKFCSAPFRKFETLIDGQVAPCCSIWIDERMGSIETQSLAEIWNSPSAIRIRESIHDGSFRYCRKDRCEFLIHDSLPDADAVDDPVLRDIIDRRETVMSRPPSWLFLAHDVTCNLSCPSCRDRVLAADEAQEARLEKIERTVLYPALAGPEPVDISLSGQGDPWSSRHYRSVLRHLADHDLNVRLHLHTNALLMTEARWSDYRGLEKYRPLVNVSIDAATPWTYATVRRGGQFEQLLKNLAFIAARRRAGAFGTFTLNATIQLDNFHEMQAIVALGKRLGCDRVLFYLIQNTGSHLGEAYERLNVADPAHPLHLAFLETLRDPILDDPIVRLYDVALWRQRALATPLPSDAVAGATPQALADRIGLLAAGETAGGTMAQALALAAHARHACDGAAAAERIALRDVDAQLLQAAGFPRQAGYRLREALAADPGRAGSSLALGTACIEAGDLREGLHWILRACAADDSVVAPAGDYLGRLYEALGPQEERRRQRTIPIRASA